jgi:hypothetical protein
VVNLGVPPAQAETGTVYVAMHSLRDGGLGPGNFLFDVTTATSKVPVGALIQVAGLTYAVDGTQSIPKVDLPFTADLWTSTPGRLVVITCLQKPDNSPSDDNFVVTAHLTR